MSDDYRDSNLTLPETYMLWRDEAIRRKKQREERDEFVRELGLKRGPKFKYKTINLSDFVKDYDELQNLRARERVLGLVANTLKRLVWNRLEPKDASLSVGISTADLDEIKFKSWKMASKGTSFRKTATYEAGYFKGDPAEKFSVTEFLDPKEFRVDLNHDPPRLLIYMTTQKEREETDPEEKTDDTVLQPILHCQRCGEQLSLRRLSLDEISAELSITQKKTDLSRFRPFMTESGAVNMLVCGCGYWFHPREEVKEAFRREGLLQ